MIGIGYTHYASLAWGLYVRNEWLKDDKFKTWVANDRTQPQVPQIFIRSRSAILLLSLSYTAVR